jgi:predicted nuclease of predicted toxin-antitoxin system
MRILIDMNLSPLWANFLEENGYEAAHWSSIGHAAAPDEQIFEVAIEYDWIILTSDLDFGTILAFTNEAKPSVFQVRTDYSMPYEIGEKVLNCLKKFEPELEEGCLITLDNIKSRVRILPLRR